MEANARAIGRTDIDAVEAKLRFQREAQDIVRSAIVNKYSGLDENPHKWVYYFRHIRDCPDNYGTGEWLDNPRNMP
jgi:hypothetical protein